MDAATWHLRFGLHRTPDGWRFAEWAPNATAIYLVGDFSDWQERQGFQLFSAQGNGAESVGGVWERSFPPDAFANGQHYKLSIHWPGGSGARIPSCARRVVQDAQTKLFAAQVWDPPPFVWENDAHSPHGRPPLIYEAHIGMAQEEERVGTYVEFRDRILPRIAERGYNTVQLMAVMEHPYYGSFGYHVSNFFAPSSRFGTPEEFKSLVDAAHGLGLIVLMDMVHSHCVKNELEGLSRFDGNEELFFHGGERGTHRLWDSRCFDYAKPLVLNFLLSNCRYWLEEFHLDGFRFDGVTSMLYTHHGIHRNFGAYDDYFGVHADSNAFAYLCLANELVRQIRPQVITIAEDVSAMPGLCAPLEEGGSGFDYRLGMGVPDFWFRVVEDIKDERWDLHRMWHALTDHRSEERVITYVESHDQALVGGQSMFFKLAGDRIYDGMRVIDDNALVDRALSLHKMMRLATLATGDGYLNFMGNEFGHPEWVDFPREGNGWSYHYARRMWWLEEDPALRYRPLSTFDRAMLALVRERQWLYDGKPGLLAIRERDKVLAFMRARVVFLFNFHPETSYADYAVELPPGTYRRILDTDESHFGGQGRIAASQRYHTQPIGTSAARHYAVRVYLPCRTALVIEKEPQATL